MLGYPEAALADAKRAVAEARDVDQGVPLRHSLYFASYTLIHCGEYEAASVQLDELIPLATEKNAAQWRGGGMMHRGCIQALTGKSSDAIPMIAEGVAACNRVARSYLFHGTFPIWREHALNLANSTMRNGTSTKPSTRLKRRARGGVNPTSIARLAISRCWLPSRMSNKRKHISHVR